MGFEGLPIVAASGVEFNYHYSHLVVLSSSVNFQYFPLPIPFNQAIAAGMSMLVMIYGEAILTGCLCVCLERIGIRNEVALTAAKDNSVFDLHRHCRAAVFLIRICSVIL